MRRRTGLAVLLVVASLPVWRAAEASTSEAGYIVVLRPSTADVDVTAARLSNGVSADLGAVYETALDGFSVTATPQEAAALARDPLVAYVEADVRVSIDTQSVPTGVARSFAGGNRSIDIDGVDDVRVDVDVAVLDGGIDLQHPDLNVVGGVDCTTGPICVAGGDDDGQHGTHVAGIIGALDNHVGTVGVAPGSRLWSVKVLDAAGTGFVSWILRGVDWVAANAGTIEVANMSLGAPGFSQALRDAIQSAVGGGVAFAVSAGNFDVDAAGYSPSAFDNVLTVSALADFDGRAGGAGTPTCRFDVDDTLADFSNWGQVVDIAAPGSCIESTVPIERGSYAVLSGTSMAAPHVSGALALLARTTDPADASDVQAMYATVLAAGNASWTDDSGDGVREPLLDLSAPSLFAAGIPPCAAIGSTDQVAWWSAEGSMVARTGPPLGGVTGYVPAVIGSGFRTDGGSSLASPDVGVVDTSMSVEFWMKPMPTTGVVQMLVSRWDFPSDDDSARSFALSLSPLGDLVFETDETTAQRPEELRAPVPTLADGNFHHVAATWDSASIRLFVDGVLVASKASQAGSLNAAADRQFRLGSKGGLGDPFRYTGVLDEVSVWERALTPTEIASIVTAGPTGRCTP